MLDALGFHSLPEVYSKVHLSSALSPALSVACTLNNSAAALSLVLSLCPVPPDSIL